MLLLKMVDLLTLEILSLTFNGWIILLFFARALVKICQATHFSSVAPPWTFTSCVAQLSFFLSLTGFLFESPFLVPFCWTPLRTSFRQIFKLVVMIIVVAPTGPSSSSSLVYSLPVWVWQTSGVHLSCYQSQGIWGS